MTDRQKLVGIMIYIILSSIDSKEEHGKRGRKAIMKIIKKKLVVEGKKDPEQYLELVEKAYELMELAKKDLGKDSFSINPGSIIDLFLRKYPEVMAPFELKEDHVNNLKEAYSSSNATFVSIQIANRLIKQIDKYLMSRVALPGLFC